MEIEQDVVHAELADHLPQLRRMIDRAVAAYKTEYSADVRRIHSRRSRASVIHDHIVHNAAEFAENEAAVELRELSHLWLLVFENGYVLRFKKVDSRKLPAGHKTQQVLKYRSQQQLDGIAPSINLDLSYQLDLEGNIHAVYLICPAGAYSNMWDSVLTADGTKPVVVSLFGDKSNIPAAEPQGAKITTKKRGTPNETESGDGNSSS